VSDTLLRNAVPVRKGLPYRIMALRNLEATLRPCYIANTSSRITARPSHGCSPLFSAPFSIFRTTALHASLSVQLITGTLAPALYIRMSAMLAVNPGRIALALEQWGSREPPPPTFWKGAHPSKVCSTVHTNIQRDAHNTSIRNCINLKQ